jgi:hypothetical protein
MKNLKPEHHAEFLRFVWARSRLPKRTSPLPFFPKTNHHFHARCLTRLDLEMNFKIQGSPPLALDNPDKYLPTSQTCFFSISLPLYTNQEIMTERLMYAIRHCVDMDNDYRI